MENITTNRPRTKTEEQKAQQAQVEAFLANPISDDCFLCHQHVVMDGTAIYSNRNRAFAHYLCHANAITAAREAAAVAAKV